MWKIVDCIFCKIVKGEIPASIAYEDEDILAFADINPVAPVHILIIPKKHISGITDLGDNSEIVGKIISVANKLAIEKEIDKSGFRIIVNHGADSGQEVFHLHFHLIGGKKLGKMG